jgi:hypothetical protein
MATPGNHRFVDAILSDSVLEVHPSLEATSWLILFRAQNVFVIKLRTLEPFVLLENGVAKSSRRTAFLLGNKNEVQNGNDPRIVTGIGQQLEYVYPSHFHLHGTNLIETLINDLN